MKRALLASRSRAGGVLPIPLGIALARALLSAAESTRRARNPLWLLVQVPEGPPMQRSKGAAMNWSRRAAVVTWVYAGMFGVPAVPVAIFLTENGRLPSLWGLFDLYAGPWSSQSADDRVVTLLVVYAGVVLVAVGSGWLLWRMRRAGAVLNLALLPVEAVFWVGFALPIPWVFGIARAALVVAAWPELAGARGREAAATPRRRARSRRPGSS